MAERTMAEKNGESTPRIRTTSAQVRRRVLLGVKIGLPGGQSRRS